MSLMTTQAYYYPNKMGRVVLLAMEEILGRNGLTAVLNQANLSRLINNYPPNNLDMNFGFAELSQIQIALEELYGPRGGRGLALRSGRACLKYGLREFGPLMGLSDLNFRLLPLNDKVRIGAALFAETFNKYTDQRVRLRETEADFIWHIERCPVCWGRQTTDPVCHLAVGILQEALFWVSGGKYFHVEETACIAMGDPHCSIVIAKQTLEH